jgi:hypothetical protein
VADVGRSPLALSAPERIIPTSMVASRRTHPFGKAHDLRARQLWKICSF